MSREIKFRSKTYDGNWVSGNLVKTPFGLYIIPQNVIANVLPQYDIDPETVGEYIGLKDKNGKEIYEGDIYHLGDKNILSIVEWHDSGFKGKQIGTYGSREGLQYWREKIEIIGNIYEHPHLLKEGEIIENR